MGLNRTPTLSSARFSLFGQTHSKRPASPVLNEIERDKRTVFCMQLAARLREKELLAFMEQAGRVRDARIITDRISGRSKGWVVLDCGTLHALCADTAYQQTHRVGYVEYYEESSVPAAIALTGQKLLGIPIVVTLTESEKNRLAEAEKAAWVFEGLLERLSHPMESDPPPLIFLTANRPPPQEKATSTAESTSATSTSTSATNTSGKSLNPLGPSIPSAFTPRKKEEPTVMPLCNLGIPTMPNWRCSR